MQSLCNIFRDTYLVFHSVESHRNKCSFIFLTRQETCYWLQNVNVDIPNVFKYENFTVRTRVPLFHIFNVCFKSFSFLTNLQLMASVLLYEWYTPSSLVYSVIHLIPNEVMGEFLKLPNHFPWALLLFTLKPDSISNCSSNLNKAELYF